MLKTAAVNGTEITYEVVGDDPKTIILIAGGGNQMLDWSYGFCQLLNDEGFRVVRFDNRDVGTSTKF